MRRPHLLLLGLFVVLAGCRDSPTSPGGPSREYRVGDRYQFNVNAKSACDEPDYRTGRVVAISQRAIVVADTANPSGNGTFSDAEYTDFAQVFDELIWPTMVRSFGEPHDLDRNERVILFFTRAVNEMTPRGQSWYVGGFFFSRDLFPVRENRDFRACSGSNEAEILYLLVPDPRGDVNGNIRTKSNELRGTVTVIAHEMQHLINASRRLFVVRAGGTGWQEETWLNEGLSHVAEELLGYEISALSPRQNIDAARLTASSADRAAFLQHQYPNANRYSEFLEDPEGNSLLGPDSLATRGATWSFLRYAADRKGGNEDAIWRELVTTRNSGISNLRTVLGAEPIDWFHEWIVSTAADDLVPGLESRYQQASWNFRSIFPWVRDANGRPLHGRYPLLTHSLEDGKRKEVEIRASSAAFLRFGVGAGSVARLRMGGNTGDCAGDAPVSLSVGQTHTIDSNGAATVCVSGGAQGGEFVLIPFSNSTTESSILPFSVTGTSIVAPASDRLRVDAELAPARLHGSESTPHDHRSARWEAELREREARELGPLVRSASPALQSSTSTAASAAATVFRITLMRVH